MAEESDVLHGCALFTIIGFTVPSRTVVKLFVKIEVYMFLGTGCVNDILIEHVSVCLRNAAIIFPSICVWRSGLPCRWRLLVS